jgi:hypothetical protein
MSLERILHVIASGDFPFAGMQTFMEIIATQQGKLDY